MTMAIRIIRALSPSDANLHAVEREEHILAIARRVAEASGSISQEAVDACASKFRNAAAARGLRTPDQITQDVTMRMMLSTRPGAIIPHSEMDIDRIMALLED